MTLETLHILAVDDLFDKGFKLATIASPFLLAYIAWRQRKNAKIQEDNAQVIKTLEKNTNSIKDALVKATGEKEHAKGVLAGRAEVTNQQESKQ